MDPILLITGSSGIAEATAMIAGREGYGVFIVGREETQCRSLSENLAGSGYFVCDLREPDATEHALQSCIERFGRVDAVFNAAGMSGREFGDGPVHECSIDGWEMTLAANAKPAFLMCRSAIRHWLKTKSRGTLLNMASVLAFSPQPQYFPTHAYAASKGAILSMSLSMAAYYASFGIRVNAIAPGLIDTPMSARAQSNQEIMGFIRRKQPLTSGIIEPSGVAETALFLLSERSRDLTGQVVAVDGGWSVTG